LPILPYHINEQELGERHRQVTEELLKVIAMFCEKLLHDQRVVKHLGGCGKSPLSNPM